MLRILRDRFIGLGRDEDGAALVVTLAVFMFIYLLFIGIWAVGTNVRTRIHLQNACDAAAYSAAVVQADTLSRIATINRAMSWTYAQMCRRQMDYIVHKWLKHSLEHYRNDLSTAQTSGSGGEHNHGYYYIGPGGLLTTALSGNENKMRLNGKSNCEPHVETTEGSIEKETANFLGHLHDASFYCEGLAESGIERMTAQLDEDMSGILAMNDELDDLVDKMGARIESAMKSIVEANLGTSEGCACEMVRAENASDYLRIMTGDEEDRFLSFAQEDDGEFAEWFPLVDSKGEGIQRSYSQTNSFLTATWSWRTTRWTCSDIVPCSQAMVSCKCGNGCEGCGCDAEYNHEVEVTASHLIDKYYNDKTYNEGLGHDWVRANPRILDTGYFGKSGTITVGLVAANKNPWSWMGDVTNGIFSAFEPFVAKTFCVASAKAGYRDFEDGKSYGRDYRIDWREDENWNLYTSDWDAVMVPVPRAASMAQDGAWEAAMTDALTAIAEKLGLTADGDFKAGGGHDHQLAFAQDGYYWDQYLDLSKDDNVNGGGNVRAKWQVGNPGSAVAGWEDLQKRMWH